MGAFWIGSLVKFVCLIAYIIHVCTYFSFYYNNTIQHYHVTCTFNMYSKFEVSAITNYELKIHKATQNV